MLLLGQDTEISQYAFELHLTCGTKAYQCTSVGLLLMLCTIEDTGNCSITMFSVSLPMVWTAKLHSINQGTASIAGLIEGPGNPGP